MIGRKMLGNYMTNLINLESLIDFSAKLNETYDKEFIYSSTLLSIMGKLKVFKTCVIERAEKRKFRIAMYKGWAGKEYANQCWDDIHSLKKILKDNGFEYFVEANYNHDLKAVICFGKKANKLILTEDEKQYINLLTQITANSLQNAENHHSLLVEKNKVEQRHQLLRTLFEVNKDFSSLLSRKQILKLLSYHLMGQLMLNKFALISIKDDNAEYILNRFNHEIDQSCINSLKDINQIILVSELKDLDLKNSLEKMRAHVITPIFVQGQIMGYILVGKKMNGEEFDERNLNYLESLANIAMLSLENERLFKEEVEKKRLESEINTALEIQTNLLPGSIPDLGTYDLAATTIPSRYVGGDYYDIINLSENETMFVIADVSGKGMPAALLMANIQASLRVLAPLKLPLIDLVVRINKLVYSNTSADKFVTMVLGILDKEKNTIKYVNAGHNPPLLYRKSESELIKLRTGGLILGVIEEPFPYQKEEIALQNEDTILFFTDGVSEAQDKDTNEFGDPRLEEFYMSIEKKYSQAVIDKILAEIKNFSEGAHQFDDITMLVIRKK